MLHKKLKNKDSEKGLAPILLPAPALLSDYSEKEQSGSTSGILSGEELKEETPEAYNIPRAYAQCC